jgi:hypothetical protein
MIELAKYVVITIGPLATAGMVVLMLIGGTGGDTGHGKK